MASKAGVFEAYDPAMFASGEPLYALFGGSASDPCEPIICQRCGHTSLVRWPPSEIVKAGKELLAKHTRPSPLPDCPRCKKPL